MNTVLFDMDGTLVPMDQEEFTRAYFRALTRAVAPHGYEPKALVDAIWKGIAAMVKNDGSRTNYQVFWAALAEIYGEKIYADIPLFDRFYAHEFDGLRSVVGLNKKAAQTVSRLGKSARLVLASNPIFPRIAQETRLRWANIDPSNYELITSYENSRFCKPNTAYYSEILDALGVKPQDCLMIGNDAVEDLAAAKIDIRVFLLTDCLINNKNIDISGVPHGNYSDLETFLDGLGL